MGQLKFEYCKTCFLLLNTFKLTDSHLRLDVRAQLGTVIDLLNHFLYIANAFSDFRHNFISNSYFVSQENEVFIKTEQARVSFQLNRIKIVLFCPFCNSSLAQYALRH